MGAMFSGAMSSPDQATACQCVSALSAMTSSFNTDCRPTSGDMTSGSFVGMCASYNANVG